MTSSWKGADATGFAIDANVKSTVVGSPQWWEAVWHARVTQ